MFFGDVAFWALPKASSERCAFGATPNAIHWDILFASVASVFKSGVRDRGSRPNKFPNRERRTGEADSFPLQVSFGARRRYAPTQSRNARPRAASGRLHRDNRKPCATARTIPARYDRARCKSQSAQQNTPQSACTQIIAANSGERIFQDDFCESMQIGFAASHDRNFSLKKQVEFSGKRTFRTSRAFGNSLNAPN